jgi:hypothetical protein
MVFLNTSDGKSVVSEFGPAGGIVKLDNIAAGADITTVVTVEFVPKLGLPAFVKQFKGKADALGVIGLFQLFLDETTCFVDPTACPSYGDYLTCQLKYGTASSKQSQVVHLLKNAGSILQFETAEFVIVRDSTHVDEPAVEIAGRLLGAFANVLGTFTVSELEAAGALVPIWNCNKGHVVFRPVGRR